ncbi:MAG: NTP transferase domain-containing protein [Acidobacteria bacterium]|nr:NTP transferase domain-containing protein [Acidobacteriota bacterium]
MASPPALPPALVLTAGLGTRLQPLTSVRAKPAAPVAGRAIVLRILDGLARAGVTDAVLNLHHRPETITGAVGCGEASGIRVRYSWEPRILGSAGGPRQALPLLGPRLLIVNGDTLADLAAEALAGLVAAHARSGAAVTLAVMPHPDPARYGGVVSDHDGRALAFSRAGGPPSDHFIGVQVAEASVFADLPAGVPAATIGEVYDRMLLNGGGRPTGAIRTHRVEGRFFDVGTPADYLAASLALALALDEPAVAGAGSVVDSSASLTRCAIWDRVTIGPGCRLHECIVADDVSLPDGANLARRVMVTSAAARASGRHDGQPIGDTVAFPIDA